LPSMVVRYGVRLIGSMYVVIGVLGLVPIDALNPPHDHGTGVRYLLHLIAINAPHDLVHLVIGTTGLLASRTTAGARLWGVVVGTLLLALFFAGMVQAALQGFPPDQRLFGLIPLNSPGHVLHAISGGAALYLGLGQLRG
jgi:hypothetical protein